MAHYETLRARVRKVERKADIEKAVEVVRDVLAAIDNAALTKSPRTKHGTIAVDLSQAEARARHYSLSLPVLEGGEDD